jgi:hypothetical protein
MAMRHLIIAMLAGGVLTASIADAQQMRRSNRIATPKAVLQNAPDGASIVGKVENIPADDVRQAVENLSENWNSGDISGFVSDDFDDARRFNQNMTVEVPRDARLRLESVQGVQTVRQIVAPDGRGGMMRISTVTATASTRLEFNDAAAGFLSIPGTNEITFEVTEPVN